MGILIDKCSSNSDFLLYGAFPPCDLLMTSFLIIILRILIAMYRFNLLQTLLFTAHTS